MPRADDRTAQKRQADDAVAASTEITVTPELWLKGVKVDAAAMGFEPYVLRKRNFATRAEEAAAKAQFDAMCAAGFAPEKAYRMCLCESDVKRDAERAALIARLAL